MPRGRSGKAWMWQRSSDPGQSGDADKRRKPYGKASRRMLPWRETQKDSSKQADQYALSQRVYEPKSNEFGYGMQA